MTKRKTTTRALEIMTARWGKDPGWQQGLDVERRKLAIGFLIQQSRVARGLTQKELARKAGTSQSAISRIEDASYDGLKIETLERIALALRLPLGITLGRHRVRLQPALVKRQA